MTEAEFYYLFTDTFNRLDPMQTGYVYVRDINIVLYKMHNIISNGRISMIGIKNKDILIDYEQFSTMLLGTNL